MTSFILLVIRYVFRVPLRMSEEMLLIGDDAVHGEDAYTFSDPPDFMENPNVQDLEIGNPVPPEGSGNGKEPARKQD